MKSDLVHLRPVQITDQALVYHWENNPEIWAVSERDAPYSQSEIQDLIASSMNFEETKQMRWIILETDTSRPIGAVDVFQGERSEGAVGMGILIANQADRRKGYAEQAILRAIQMASQSWGLHTFWATIHETNLASIGLFSKCGFQKIDSYVDNFNFETEKTQILHFQLCVKK